MLRGESGVGENFVEDAGEAARQTALFEDRVLSVVDPETEGDFYETIVQAYEVGRKVVEQKGHGMTFVIARGEKTPVLDDILVNSKPFNGDYHTIFDNDIVDTILPKRERDLSFVILGKREEIITDDGRREMIGRFVASNVPLPVDARAFQKKYGIPIDIGTFMGYSEKEGDERFIGARALSSAYGSDVMVRSAENDEYLPLGPSVQKGVLGIVNRVGAYLLRKLAGEKRINGGEQKIEGEAMVLTFGENGGVNAYCCGDLLYSSAGRRMLWEQAERRPNIKTTGYCSELRSDEKMPEEELPLPDVTSYLPVRDYSGKSSIVPAGACELCQ